MSFKLQIFSTTKKTVDGDLDEKFLVWGNAEKEVFDPRDES